MAYGIRFKEENVNSTGNIYHLDGFIYFTGGDGVTVKVEVPVYHKRMQTWIENRMKSPLVFVGDDGSRCTLTAPAASGDVVVELSHAARMRL